MSLTVEMPWPSAALSVNTRQHWSKRASAARTSRRDGWAATLQALKGKPSPYASVDGPIAVCVIFRPPDMRRRDMDGMLSRCKALLDGLADALGVDDSRFVLALHRGEVHYGGRVIVEVGALAAVQG